MKVYRVFKNKIVALAVIGSQPPEKGFNLVGAHIDSPRIDLKPNPIYEANEMVFLKTHYIWASLFLFFATLYIPRAAPRQSMSQFSCPIIITSEAWSISSLNA